jgi:hypothetical protein
VRWPWEQWAEKRRVGLAYRVCLPPEGEHAKVVLADLAVFCRATSTAADDPEQAVRLDPMALAREEGKRAVWLRVRNMLALQDVEIVEALRAHRREIMAEIEATARQSRPSRATADSYDER